MLHLRSASPERISRLSRASRIGIGTASASLVAAVLAVSALGQEPVSGPPPEGDPAPETSPAPEVSPDPAPPEAPAPSPEEPLMAPQSVGFGTGFTGEKYYCQNTTVAPNSYCFSEGLEHYYYNAAIRFDPRPWNQGLWVCSSIDVNPAGSSQPNAPGGPYVRCGYDLVRLCLNGQSYPNCNDQDGYIAQPYVENYGQTRHQIRGHAAW